MAENQVEGPVVPPRRATDELPCIVTTVRRGQERVSQDRCEHDACSSDQAVTSLALALCGYSSRGPVPASVGMSTFLLVLLKITRSS